MILSNVKQKCGPLPLGSAVNLNKLNLIEIELFIKMLYGVWSSLQPDHETNNSAPDASQPSSQERWQVADLKHLKISYIFSLPRTCTKDFPYIKKKIDWSIGINYSSVNFKWTQVFLCYQSFDTLGARDFSFAVSGFRQDSQRSMSEFFKNFRSYKISLNQRVSRVSLWWYGWELRWMELGCIRRSTSQEIK